MHHVVYLRYFRWYLIYWAKNFVSDIISILVRTFVWQWHIMLAQVTADDPADTNASGGTLNQGSYHSIETNIYSELLLGVVKKNLYCFRLFYSGLIVTIESLGAYSVWNFMTFCRNEAQVLNAPMVVWNLTLQMLWYFAGYQVILGDIIWFWNHWQPKNIWRKYI